MFEQIQAAATQLAGHAHVTPLMTSTTLDQQFAAQIFFKCENFQRVGAFKFRGAYNAISNLNDEQKSRGVLAFSSGNHAQAIACVGKLLNVSTTIVMPDNSPQSKLAATRAYGATVILYNAETQVREEVATQILAQQALTLIPPFDHPAVIAGQGTVALEMLNSQPNLDMILAPCGGGGLLSGTAVAVKNIRPNCRVIGVEPEVANDATLSFKSGRLHVIPNPPTIADGTRTASLGKLTFPIIQEYVDDMVTVSEDAIKQAVSFLFYRMKLVVEPSGALGLAALLSGAIQAKGRVGVILSGGNIDGQTMADILRDSAAL